MSKQQQHEAEYDDDELVPAAMKPRAIRVDDETWDDAIRIARERGDNVSELVRAALRRYVKRHSELTS